MNTVSGPLLFFAVLCPFVFIAVHVAAYRAKLRSGDRFFSPQVQIVLLHLIFNAAILILVVLIGYAESFTIEQYLSGWVYTALVFNGFGYSYFHWFNLSETGRRVRMIIEIHRKGRLETDALREIYSPHQMVEERVDRLERAQQIEKNAQGKYRLSSPILPIAAFCLSQLARFLGSNRTT